MIEGALALVGVVVVGSYVYRKRAQIKAWWATKQPWLNGSDKIE